VAIVALIHDLLYRREILDARRRALQSKLILPLRAIGSTLMGITYANALSEKEQEELHHVQKLITQAGFEVENQIINFLLDIVPSRVSSVVIWKDT